MLNSADFKPHTSYTLATKAKSNHIEMVERIDSGTSKQLLVLNSL